MRIAITLDTDETRLRNERLAKDPEVPDPDADLRPLAEQIAALAVADKPWMALGDVPVDLYDTPSNGPLTATPEQIARAKATRNYHEIQPRYLYTLVGEPQ